MDVPFKDCQTCVHNTAIYLNVPLDYKNEINSYDLIQSALTCVPYFKNIE